jgi:hypothetical protein
MTPDQLQVLAVELSIDPAGLGYAAHLPDSPGIVADMLNALTQTKHKTRFITERAIMSRCQDGNVILDALEDKADTNSAIRRALKFLGQEAGLDIGDPYTLGMVGTLVSQGVLTAAQGDQLKALALQSASRAEVIGLPVVSDLHVVKALELNQ